MNNDNAKIFQALIKMAVKQARGITNDQEALEVKCLYKQWEKQLGRQLEVGEYIQHEDRLYRVLQQHVAQETWTPGVGTESLYVVIDKEHSGTESDPIPWVNNMECFNGKYYIEDEVLYLCVRDSGIALQCKIVDVLGNYFVLANAEEIIPPVEEQPNPPEENGGEDDNKSEEGTKENPIPYQVGVTPLENGKYYIENDVVYLCNRSEAVVYHNLSALIGLYVVLA